jgi:uncharacterized protein YceH (UPF0502 family)
MRSSTPCNQKTNREPVVQYDETAVQAALSSLEEKGWAESVLEPGSRAVRYRHRLVERLELRPGEQAVLTVLLLRGPQTGRRAAHAHRAPPLFFRSRRRSQHAPAAGRARTLSAGPPARAAPGHEGKPLDAHAGGRAGAAAQPASPRPALEQRVERLEVAIEELRAELDRLRQELARSPGAGQESSS